MQVLQDYKIWYDNQRELCGDKWVETNKLFIQDNGKAMHPDTIGKWFQNFVERIGLPVINFHGLRHTNVTLMIAKGIQTQIISRKVGHSSVQTTDRVYSHFFEDEFKNVPNVMEDFLCAKPN